ncbi:hypothetical protein DL96DRAFT_1470601, partial [Flagelloscypha sp. PMI_526]
DPTHIRLLSGPLPNFQAVAMNEHSGWLQSLASDICGPRPDGGTLYRLDSEDPVLWTPVKPNDPLEAKIYEYKPSAELQFSKLSARNGRSKTQKGQADSSSSMRNEVLARDGTCWFCGHKKMPVNSRIVSKRMGDEQVRILVREWCNLVNCQWGVFTAQLGILLCPEHNAAFDNYMLGLRHVPLQGVDSYMIHFFETCRQTEPMLIRPSNHVLNGHGYCITAPNPTHPQNPPAELFKWHYMQCVLEWFAHEDYMGLPYIRWAELPLRDRDDDDSDFDSDEADFSKLWPSAILDFGRRRKSVVKKKPFAQNRWLTG